MVREGLQSTRSSQVLKRKECAFDLFTLHSSAGVLSGVICLHVDDMLGIGDDLFELKLKELDKLVGFGSMKRQKFDYCGRQCEKTCQW